MPHRPQPVGARHLPATPKKLGSLARLEPNAQLDADLVFDDVDGVDVID
jgi:hypothetical protein